MYVICHVEMAGKIDHRIFVTRELIRAAQCFKPTIFEQEHTNVISSVNIVDQNVK